MKKTLKLTPYPVNLVLEIISSCNLRCLACPYPNLKREKGQKMSEKLYQKIINEVAENSPKDTIVWYAFMGEPLMLGKELFNRVKYAKAKGIKNIYLNTNANLLNDELADLAIESGIDKIIISVDAYKESSYNQIRKGGDLNLLKKNTINLLNKLKKNNLEKPEITVQFIVMEENKSEEEEFKNFWLNKGAQVKIRRKLGWGGSIESKDLIIPQEERDMPCPWLMRQMIILWNGQTAQCDADYEGAYSAGDVNEKSVYDVWNGKLLERRKRHINNDFDFKPCNGCSDWQVGLSEFHKPNK